MLLKEGQTFGKLTVVKKAEIKKGHIMYECLCDCGGTTITRRTALLTGNTKSCGCYNDETRLLTLRRSAERRRNGATVNRKNTPEYNTFIHMKARCYRKTNAKYKNYGARGIVVCDRWKNSFTNFFEDMGKRPTPNHTIDRIDNDGNYEPSNCRWTTNDIQASNKTTNRYLIVNGERIHQSGLARYLRVTDKSIEYHRKKGKTGDQIVSHFNYQ